MSLIIFDFDGTIADSFAYVFDFLLAEAGKRAPAHPRKADYRRLAMKDMALQLGVPAWRLPYLYFKGRRTMREHLLKLQPFGGMPDVIRQLQADGHTLAIVSSNSTKNVRKFLRNHELNACFKVVRGGAGLFGKVTPIKQLRRRFRAGECWYVGDEVTDIASAKAAGVQSLAVAWGFGGHETLARYEPTALAEHAADIRKIINQ